MKATKDFFIHDNEVRLSTESDGGCVSQLSGIVRGRIWVSLCTVVLMLFSWLLVSCSESEEQRVLNHVESVIEAHPDSALTLLRGVDKASLDSDKERARYALLMSMALDKNYIDTTTFDVIQPAIDYYLDRDKGTPDDKLRTYYYQGRIFDNRKDRDNAINCFAKALDNTQGVIDSLCIARTLVAQAGLYSSLYDFASYTNYHLRAANIYKKYSYKDYEFDCLLNAFNGANVMKDKSLADSILNLCHSFSSLDESQRQILNSYKLSYLANLGTKKELSEIVLKQQVDSYDVNGLLNLAFAYNKLSDNAKSKQLLDDVYGSGVKFDTLKYQAILITVQRDLGNYKQAFLTYWDYAHKQDSIFSILFERKQQFIEEKHDLELKAQNEAIEKSKIFWRSIGIIAILALGVIILLLILRSNKAKKELAFQKAKSAELENERLKTKSEKLALEKSRLALEYENLQLERDNKALEAENLAHRVETLENESESLKSLIANTTEEIPLEVQSAIKVRIEMLNSLLAGYITSNEQYEKPYDLWVKELTDNTEEFMNSNRLAFQVSHPKFIEYFEEHGLAVDEINYVCLYAIGLRGKEVGNYMKKRSHVNISSAIRKKLGIDKHETNIGIYVRKLLKSL